MNNVILIVISIVAGGAFVGIWLWFSARLRKLQRKRWGDKA